MAFPKFIQVRTDDRVINQLQTNLDKCLRPILGNELLDTVLIKNISLKSGQVNFVPHTLGHKLNSYNIALHGNSIVWDTQIDNPSPNLLLYLNCSSDVIIDLIVF